MHEYLMNQRAELLTAITATQEALAVSDLSRLGEISAPGQQSEVEAVMPEDPEGTPEQPGPHPVVEIYSDCENTLRNPSV